MSYSARSSPDASDVAAPVPILNSDIARSLEKLADLIELEGGNPFRIRAYRNAARIDQARRGWLEPADIINTRDLAGVRTMLRR